MRIGRRFCRYADFVGDRCIRCINNAAVGVARFNPGEDLANIGSINGFCLDGFFNAEFLDDLFGILTDRDAFRIAECDMFNRCRVR